MATEDIVIEDGRIKVDRFGTKTNVDVPVSDVESLTFIRSGDPTADGSLIVHIKKGIVLDESGEGAAPVQHDVVIRVSNDDAGEVLASIRESIDSTKETKSSISKKEVADKK